MIEFGHLSHVGLRRELNEDTYFGDAELGLWLVADGMGGHEFGEVASALARDTVVREVHEEVGIQVGNLQYLGSQGWPFPHSLMLGFHAEYVGGEIVPQPEEIEDARWFAIDQLPPLPMQRSIARYLIDLYVARRLGHPEPQLPR